MRVTSFAIAVASCCFACSDAPAPPADVAPLVVLDAGAEPRAAFASVAAVGSRYDVTLTQSSSMALFADGKTIPETSVPALHLTLGVEVVERTRDAAKLRFAVAKADLDPSIQGDPSTRHMLEQELKTGSITGLGGFVSIDDAGLKRSTTSNLPNTASSILRQVLNQVRQSLDQTVVPLPRDPIGVGARWSTVRTFDFSGIELSERATWTLTARTASTWSVRGEFEYSALGAVVKFPGMPDDAKLTLREMRGSGRGEYELDPGLAIPRSSNTVGTVDLKANALVKDKVEPIDATITMRCASIASQR